MINRFFVSKSEYDDCMADFRMINSENKRLKNQIRTLKIQIETLQEEKESYRLFADLFSQIIEDVINNI